MLFSKADKALRVMKCPGFPQKRGEGNKALQMVSMLKQTRLILVNKCWLFCKSSCVTPELWSVLSQAAVYCIGLLRAEMSPSSWLLPKRGVSVLPPLPRERTLSL